MTGQEAIWVLKDFDKQVTVKADGAYQSTIGEMACEIAISALEKQIAKKPKNTELTTYSGGTQVLHAYCPICEQPIKIYNGHQKNKVFRRDEDVFCSYCGQKLDWSDE